MMDPKRNQAHNRLPQLLQAALVQTCVLQHPLHQTLVVASKTHLIKVTLHGIYLFLKCGCYLREGKQCTVKPAGNGFLQKFSWLRFKHYHRSFTRVASVFGKNRVSRAHITTFFTTLANNISQQNEAISRNFVIGTYCHVTNLFS